MRGHHVLGEYGPQPVADFVQVGRALLAEQEPDQEGVAALAPATGHHGRAPDARELLRKGGDGDLHLGGLHPESAHLHLVVGPAQPHGVAVGQHPAHITGAVEAGPGPARVRYEPLLGQVRTALVAQREAGAAQVDLPVHTGRHRLQPVVQHMDLGSVDGRADRRQRGPAGRVAGQQVGAGDVGLGRAVLVFEQRGPYGAEAAQFLGDAQLLPGGDQDAQRARPDPQQVGGLGDGLQRDERHEPALDLLLVQQPQQNGRVAPVGVGDQVQGAAARHGGEDLLEGDVEAERGELQRAGAGRIGLGAQLPLRVVGPEPVREFHALRLAGGARGEQDQAQAVQRQRLRSGRRADFGRGGRRLVESVRARHRDRLDRQDQLRVRDQACVGGVRDHPERFRPLDHPGDPLGRIAHVERHAGRTGPQHTDDGGDHLRGAVQRDAHAGPGRCAQFPQPGRDLGGGPVQVPVGPADVAEDHGLRVGLPGRRRGEPAHHVRRFGGGVRRQFAVGRQEAEARRLVGMFHDPAQHGGEAVGEQRGLHGGEGAARAVQPEPDPAVARVHDGVGEQTEVGLLVRGQVQQLQPVGAQHRLQVVQPDEGEGGVQQRRAAPVALHRAERVRAVRVRVPLLADHVPHRLQPTGLPAAQPERHGVEEESRQPVGIGDLRAAVRDQAGGDVLGAGQQPQGQAVGGEQHQPQRHRVFPGELLYPPLEIRGQLDVVDDALARVRCLVRPERVELHELRPVEQGAPVLLGLRGLQQRPLLADVLGGGRQRPVRDRLDGRAQAVQVVLEQLAHQVGDAPAVQDRVVEAEHQVHQARAGVHPGVVQSGALVVVGVVAALLDVREDLCLCRLLGHPAQVGDVEGAGDPGVHDLQRLGVPAEGEGRPQDRVPLHQPAVRGAEGLLVPVDAQPVAEDVPVDGGASLFAAVVQHAQVQPGRRVGVDRPQAQQSGLVHAGDERERLGRRGLVRGLRIDRADLRGEGGHGGVPDHVGEGDGQSALLGGRPDPQHGDGVAAEHEVVVVDGDARDVEHLGPDLRQGLLGRVAGGGVLLRGGAGGMVGHRPDQGSPVGLAVGGERDRVDPHEPGRNHEIGQVAGEFGAQTGRVQLGVGDVRADQGAATVLRDPVQDHRAAYVGHERQPVLDLAQLDAVAADLDLAVDPAQVLQSAVGEPAGQVPGAVQARAGRERVVDEGLVGQLGPTQVAAGQAHTGDAQLAGGADRLRVAVRIEHVQFGVVDGPADRDPVHGDVRIGGAVPVRHVHRGLGGPVQVHQRRHRPAGGGEDPVEAVDLLRGQGLTGAEDPAQ